MKNVQFNLMETGSSRLLPSAIPKRLIGDTEQLNNQKRFLINTRELARLLDVSMSTIEQGRVSGNLQIPFVRLGTRAIRYRMEDVEAYIRSLRAFKSTTEADME